MINSGAIGYKTKRKETHKLNKGATSSSATTPPVTMSLNKRGFVLESWPGSEKASAKEWLGGSSSRSSSRRFRVKPPFSVGVGALRIRTGVGSAPGWLEAKDGSIGLLEAE